MLVVSDWDVRLENVTKRYGRTVAVDRLTLGVRRGELLSLLGPSGCGKTTTLRILAGLVQPTEGAVVIKGQQVTTVPVHRRNIGMVFQNYALFPHLSVAENVAFGLQMRSMPRATIRTLVAEALELVRLPGFDERFPQQLSGGQQQRVALARALVIKPAVLLLDEPFGALDKKLREGMQIELRQLQRRLEITTVFVTHDQDEALTLSDTIAVMRHGRLEQQAGPGQIYERPVSRFVADFIGASNFFHGRAREVAPGRLEVTTGEGIRLTLPHAPPPLAAGDAVTVAIRPEKIRIEAGAVEAGAPNAAGARVEQVVYRGSVTHYYLRGPGGGVLLAVQQNTDGDRPSGAVGVGAEVRLSWEASSNLVVRDD